MSIFEGKPVMGAEFGPGNYAERLEVGIRTCGFQTELLIALLQQMCRASQTLGAVPTPLHRGRCEFLDIVQVARGIDIAERLGFGGRRQSKPKKQECGATPAQSVPANGGSLQRVHE